MPAWLLNVAPENVRPARTRARSARRRRYPAERLKLNGSTEPCAAFRGGLESPGMGYVAHEASRAPLSAFRPVRPHRQSSEDRHIRRSRAARQTRPPRRHCNSSGGLGETAGFGEAHCFEHSAGKFIFHDHDFLCWESGQASLFGTENGFRRAHSMCRSAGREETRFSQRQPVAPSRISGYGRPRLS